MCKSSFHFIVSHHFRLGHSHFGWSGDGTAGSVWLSRSQARRQDSVTGGGAEINFGGHEKFIYVNSRGARGHNLF